MEDYRNALAWAMLAKDVFEAEKSAESRDSDKHWLVLINDIITDIKRKLREEGPDVEKVVSEATRLKRKLSKEEQKKWIVGGGSGFYVNEHGHILTNEHVINRTVNDNKISCDYISVMSPLDTVPRFVDRIGKVDASLDLAVLHDPNHQDRNVPDSGLQYAKFRSRKQPIEPGEYAIVIGFPLSSTLAFETHITTGIVVAPSTTASDRRQFIISAPVQSGNSGGPVLDANGNVIGVVVEKRSLRSRAPEPLEDILKDIEVIQTINDAISLEQVRGFLEEALKDEDATYEEATLSSPIDNTRSGGCACR